MDEDEDDVPVADEYDLADLGEWGDWVTHVAAVNELLQNESPRGAAVLARAYLDDSLGSALLTAAIHNTKRRRDLVQAAGNSPRR